MMGARRCQQRGAAMLMVMVVLSLLLILAVSFTFLMSQQEGTAVAALGLEQTRITTRTGADHAYARLNRGNRLNEYERWYGMIPADVTEWDNHNLDTRDEAFVSLKRDFADDTRLFTGMTDPDGRQRFPVSDPRRYVQGLTVADETGKANLNFSNVVTIANLLGSAILSGDVNAEGMVYPQVNLSDASFLDAYDGTSSGRSSGYVVIDGQLFSYSSRSGNALYNVIANPRYNGVDGMNALFRWASPDRQLKMGEFVTTPTALKVMLYKVLNARAGVPAWFNSVADIRRVADLPRLFNNDLRFGPEVMGQLMGGWPEGIDPVTYQVLEETASTLTPAPHFDGGWFYPHVVTWGDMLPVGESGLNILVVNYDHRIAFQSNYYVPNDPRIPLGNNAANYNWAGYGTDNIVRLRNAAGTQIIGWVMAGNPGNAQIVCRGDWELDVTQGWIIEVAEKASVNINTANFETLVALFQGVGPRNGSGPIAVNEARRVASRILAYLAEDTGVAGDGTPLPPNSFANLNSFLSFLTTLSQEENPPIFGDQVGMFALQQRFPYSRQQSPVTMPLRFDSADAYMVDAFATSYQPAGGTRARNAMREWALVGSDAQRTIHWRLYQQLQDEMRMPQGNIMQLQRGNIINQRQEGMLELPYLHYLQDERHIRAWRAPPWSSPQTRNMFNLGNDSVRPEKFYSNVAQVTSGSGASYQAGDLEAGMFSLWYRRQWEDLNANHYVFDVAEQEYSNRMSLLWWGERVQADNMTGKPGALVYRVKDRTLEEACTELRFELDANAFRHHEWYHMAMNWKGTDLSHVNMVLDGDCSAGTGNTSIKPTVQHSFRKANGGWVSRTSELQMDLEDPKEIMRTQFELQIDPNDIDAFPDQGVVVIGDEAMEYNGKLGTSLVNLYRGPPNPNVAGSATGARGTIAKMHPRGSKVTVFGYTAPLRAWAIQHAANEQFRPTFPNLPQTRGNLASGFSNDPFWRVGGPGTANASYYRATELGPDAGFAGAGDQALGGDPNHLRLLNYFGLPNRGLLLLVGPAFRRYFPPGTPGVPASPPGSVEYPNWSGNPTATTLQFPVPYSVVTSPHTEIIAYNGISSQGLNVLARYDLSFNRIDPADYWHFLGAYQTNLFPPPPPGPAQQTIQNYIDFFSTGTCVCLLSIDIDDATGYHPRSIVQVDNEWLQYHCVWNPLVGSDPTGATPTGRDDHLFPALLYLNPNVPAGMVIGAAATNNNNPALPAPWRGAMGTTPSVHQAAARVLPTFGTTVKSGNGDIITLVNGKNGNKELHRIRLQRNLRTYASQIGLIWLNAGGQVVSPTPNWDEYICALYDHTGFDYLPNTMSNVNNPNFPYTGTNLCKFPTGELPVELPVDWRFAGADTRTADGGNIGLTHSADFDSFELRMYNKGNFRLLVECNPGSPAEGGEIIVNLAPTGNFGVVKIDEELICYRAVAPTTVNVFNTTTYTWGTQSAFALQDITRGVLGTVVQSHAAGTTVMNMASLRIGRPLAAGGASENLIQTVMGEDSFRAYGFVRLTDNNREEVIGYQRYTETQVPDPNNPGLMIRRGEVLSGLYKGPWQQALFRGAFGTRAMGWGDRALFFDQPVRFPDWFPGFCYDAKGGFEPGHTSEPLRAIPGAESPEISHFQGSMTLRNSMFTRFRWRIQYAPLADPLRHADAIGARLVIRFKEAGKPTPEWGSLPTNRPGGLYAFDFDLNGPFTEDLGATRYEQTEDFTRMPGVLGGIRAERIEFRVYFYFRQNAFANEDHKTTLQFHGADADVIQHTRIVRHEEKR